MSTHELMWNEIKKHYKNKIERFEKMNRGNEEACLFAKSTLNVMKHFELKYLGDIKED